MITDLIGKTLSEVTQNSDDSIIFKSLSGHEWKMYHQQDCCESVYIESVHGDLQDLVDAPIIRAEERTFDIEDGQATFYEITSTKGGVTIRWNGFSEYYSVAVDFEQTKAPTAENIQNSIQMIQNLRARALKCADYGEGLSIYDRDDLLEIAAAIDVVLGAVKVEQ